MARGSLFHVDGQATANTCYVKEWPVLVQMKSEDLAYVMPVRTEQQNSEIN